MNLRKISKKAARPKSRKKHNWICEEYIVIMSEEENLLVMHINSSE